MNRLGRILRYFTDAWQYAVRASPVKVVVSALPDVSTAITDLGEAERAERARRLAMTSAWAYSDISLIAKRVAQAMCDVRLMRTTPDGDKEVRDHPALDLLNHPNDVMDAAFLWRYTVFWYLLAGNAYIVIVTPGQGTGQPLELWPLPAPRLRPVPQSLRRGRGAFATRNVVDYEYASDRGIITLPGEAVIHLRTPNPFDYWQGLSPLSAAARGLEIDNGQTGWVLSFFTKDNAIPARIVSLPQGTPKAVFDAVREQLREEFGGKYKTLVTTAGQISVEVVQQTIEQMKILEGREFTRDEIDRIFGVPQGLLSKSLSGDSRLAATIAFARETLQPLLNDLVSVLNMRLMPYYAPDGSLWLEAPNVVPEDRMLRVQEYRTYSMDRTINENREAQGLPPISAPWADIPVRLLTPMRRGAPPGFGLPAPEQLLEQRAGKEGDVWQGLDMTKAVENAWRYELRQWQKVALASLRHEGDPLAREFLANVLPDDVVDMVTDKLSQAKDADAVRAVFRKARHHLFGDYWRDGRHEGASEAEAEEGQEGDNA